MEDGEIDAFVKWFRSNGGYVDMEVMGVTEFPGSGRGAIALRDISDGHTLFTLPRTLTLSTRTSPLPSLFGFSAWHAHGLHKGWVGLILCMMWEDAWTHELDGVDGGRQGNVQKNLWGPYMRTLPTKFDTPMFWNAEELEELRGTAVLEKIGHEDAERAYAERLIPAINTSYILFPPSHHQKWYTLDAYHRAGSRILSRSFTVSRWTDGDEADGADDRNSEVGESYADEADDRHLKTSEEPFTRDDSAQPDPSSLQNVNEGEDSDSEDDGDDDPSDVAMVPMADILNARWGSENAKLFYEPAVLRMVTTKKIKEGEQIFNTYGDPPNSDLLRRYGHVDLVRQHFFSSAPAFDEEEDVEMKDDADAETIKNLGNPSDVVEIRADLIVDVVQGTGSGLKARDVRTRIEWWLDEGEDDTFVLSLPDSGSPFPGILPPALISLTRLLLLADPDFKSACSKAKLPKGNLKKVGIEESKEVLEILDEVFKRREGMYAGGTVEDDERVLSVSNMLPSRKRHAVVVRLGEKRILKDTRKRAKAMLTELTTVHLNEGGHGDDLGNTRRDEQDLKVGKEMGNSRKRVVNGAGEDRRWKRARK